MNLAEYDSKRMVLVVHKSRQRRLFRGTASYEFDPQLGAVLRICASPESQIGQDAPEFILQENAWEGAIEPDRHFGCDYSIDLNLP